MKYRKIKHKNCVFSCFKSAIISVYILYLQFKRDIIFYSLIKNQKK